MAEQRVDLQKLQEEYQFIEAAFDRLNAELNDVTERAARISAAKGAHVALGLGEYHNRTIEMLDKLLDRMEDAYDKLVEAGAASLSRQR